MRQLDQTIYDELRAMARAKLASQKSDHTLQPTALVNEAWMKLREHFDMSEPTAAFFKTAAEAMRQILIDHARAKHRLKRGGPDRRRAEISNLDDVANVTDESDPDELLALNEAIDKLEALDPQVAQVVKLRFFAGLSVTETATALSISERTVKRDWQFAKSWLLEQMRQGQPES